MTAVHPLPRFNIIRKSTRKRLMQGPCRKMSVVAATDVIADVSEQSNKDSDDAGFCGEPFADNGELLSSLSPLLFCMKLFGLYFHRQDRRPRPTDDPERNPAATTRISGLRVYATIVLILVWFNAVRLAFLFVKNDQFGAILLMKVMLFASFNLTAIMYTAYYYANHTGKLHKILTTLSVTSDCVRSAHRVAINVTTATWTIAVLNLSIRAYVHFTPNAEYDFIFAPFFTYIDVPDQTITVVKLFGYLAYLIFFPGALFSHAMSLLIVYILCHQFHKLKKHFRRAIGKRGRFSGDLCLFRRRYRQTKGRGNLTSTFNRFISFF